MRARHRTARSVEQTSCVNDHPPFTPSIPTDDVFRKLIITELRSGRLTPKRRQEISRYALQFGLSLAQTEDLIANAKRCTANDGETLEPTTNREARDCRRHPSVKPIVYVIGGVFLILLDVAIVALT